MKSVIIFYFSGTGNTELIAEMVKEQFIQNSFKVDMLRIEDVLKQNLKIDLHSYDLIGIGSQVLGFTSPNIVMKFVKSLPRGNSEKIFIFRTAAGVAPQNYNASKSIKRVLSKKGYDVFHERVFSINSNWIGRFDDAIVTKLFEADKRKAAIMCQEVIKGEKRILNAGLKLGLIMGLIAKIAPPIFRIASKDFVVSKSCTNCGLCIKNCPSQNIIEKNGKIKFKMSCNTCMRCVYLCPQKAINYRLLKFFIVPGGYNIRKTLQNPCPSNEEEIEYIPPFFKEYIKNDAL
jgi:ferredoxin/menaquinone-dependent protoporphyrinogen IX oxidase